MKPTIRIVIVEDNYLQRIALENILAEEEDMLVVKALAHGKHLLPVASQLKFEVLLLDLMMRTGSFDPLSTIQTFQIRHPHVRILVLTSVQDEIITQEILALGVAGYLLKDDEAVMALPETLRAIMRGETVLSPSLISFEPYPTHRVLTPHELSVILLVAQGYTNEQIAEALHLTAKTVRNHLVVIYKKLDVPADVNPRTYAVRRAQQLGLIP